MLVGGVWCEGSNGQKRRREEESGSEKPSSASDEEHNECDNHLKTSTVTIIQSIIYETQYNKARHYREGSA